jgi:hypothetical protein
MLRDYTISKPATVRGYALHQMVLGLTKSGSVLFCDKGNQLIIRSEQPICDAGADIKSTYDGDIIGFELQACISKKVKGKHRYFHSRDWRSRHAWLAIEGKKHGFEPLTINSRSRMVSIDKGDGQSFKVDCTSFVGVLKIIENDKFRDSLATGIGSTAKTFGFGMMLI